MTDDELIEAIATEVMGWHKKDFQYWMLEPSTATHENGDTISCEYFTMLVAPGINPFWMPQGSQFFSPITDMNHAFMVVEKMRDLGFNSRIENFSNGNTEVEFYQNNTSPTGYAVNLYVGHAICLAALEAKRGKK